MEKNVFGIIRDEIHLLMCTQSYYSALMVVLSLPGICASIDSGRGSTSGRDKELYEEWLHKYTCYKVDSLIFTNKIVYQTRCKLFHNGRFLNEISDDIDFDILFVLPSNVTITSNNGGVLVVVNDKKYLRVNLDDFIQNILNGVNEWMPTASQTKEYKKYIEGAARLGTENLGQGFESNISAFQ